MNGPNIASQSEQFGDQGATRKAVVGKSPMLYPEQYCCGDMGGLFGAELKKAGYDGLVITGRVARPSYLWVDGSDVRICDASSL